MSTADVLPHQGKSLFRVTSNEFTRSKLKISKKIVPYSKIKLNDPASLAETLPRQSSLKDNLGTKTLKKVSPPDLK